MPVAGPAHSAPLSSQWARDITAAVNDQLAGAYADAAARDAAIAVADRRLGSIAYLTIPKRTTQWDGVGWVTLDEPIQTNTTACFTGITHGAGTPPSYATRYRRRNGMCWFYSKLTFGATPTAIANIRCTLPFASAGVPANSLHGHLTDTGLTNYVAWVGAGLTFVDIAGINVAGTYGTLAFPTLTVPHTWGATDLVEVSGEYEMASRYS